MDLSSFQVVVKGTNGTIVVNSTLSPDANDMTLSVPAYAESQLYMIQIAAENKIGLGPFSTPLELEFDPAIILVAEFDSENGDLPSGSLAEQRRKQVWIIGAASAALFVLILISTLLCYKRKLRNRQKPLGYLAASTTDDIHCQLSRHSNGPIIKDHSEINPIRSSMSKTDASLWIDRRWGSDSCEKDSNSSEKKLLSNSKCHHNHTHSNSNSDTEYAYVENKHNISAFTNSSGSRKAAESPEPYATTDIFQKHVLQQSQRGQQVPHTNQHNHYSAPIIHNYRRNVHSCDDLTDNGSGADKPQPIRSQHYAQHYAQQYSASQHYQRQASTGMCGGSRKPRNLLDMIPPPPVHPPPTAPYSNGGIYGKSQESVISPKYLFAHPMYQGTTNSYKVHPSHAVSNNPRSHYEQVDQNSVVTGAPVQPPRVVFDRDCHDELQHFNAMLTQFTNSQNNMGHPITQNTKRANSTTTSQTTAKSVKSDQFSLHCEADNECEDGSEEDEASSLTASHKSDNY